MVGFGQVICLPVSPRCDLCYIGRAKLCPSYRKVDPKTLGKRVPVYYKNGTVDRGEGPVPIKDDPDAHVTPTEAVIRSVATSQALEW